MSRSRYRPRPIAVLLLLLAGCATAPPAPSTFGPIRVTGAVLLPAAWSAESIGETFPDQVRVVEHVTRRGVTHRLRAVPIASLLASSRPALDPERKNHELSFAAVARARDGYAVTYSYEELVPYGQEPTVYLAFAGEDAPLPDALAPARIVCLGPKNSSRTPHAVVEIEVVDLATTHDEPAAVD